MDERLALIIGKIILAYGRLDQQLWSILAIMALKHASDQVVRGERQWMEPEEIDKRFDRRLAHYRRLCAALSQNDSSVLAIVDRMLNEIRDVERIRAHMAHGNLHEREGRIAVSDGRESQEHSLEFRKAIGRRATSKEISALWDKHLNISYAQHDLEAAAQKLGELSDQLHSVAERLL
jgi:hypothetical protein